MYTFARTPHWKPLQIGLLSTGLFIILTLTSIGCDGTGDGDERQTGEFGRLNAVVTGRVTGPNSDPLSDVRLTVTPIDFIQDEGCEAGGAAARPESTRTGDAGEYVLTLSIPSGYLFKCAEIQAVPSSESGLDTAFVLQPVEVELRIDPPYDTARVDVVLPPN